LACTRLVIEAVTDNGEELYRTWRHDGLLSSAAIAERVRWQLDGWLTGTSRGRRGPTAGIVRLRLVPEGVVTHLGLQQGLWGEAGEERDRAHRALTRVQGLLGPEAVLTAVESGGRGEGDRVRLVPWGDERTPSHPIEPPWPGRLPQPVPTIVYPQPLPTVVEAADGAIVGVTARLAVTAAPARIVLDDGVVEITGWAGPWPVDERWWDGGEARRGARFQVLLADGRALLVVLAAGRWSVAATYE
jgi:protein ImuB